MKSDKEMKGLKLFLAACFIAPILDSAVADNAKNISRTKNSDTVTSTRKTTTTKTRNAITTTKNIIQRNSSVADKSRNASTSVVARSTKKPNISARTTQKNILSRTAQKPGTKARVAATTKTRESVMQRDFGKCKTVFFDCMDEFCANKDAQLKRCACSTRANEFKSTQKSLDNVEDKLQDFSQRLLQVNMDPADAAVINQATEGEDAYYATRDKTASKKTLDNIAKKLNASFDSAENNNMSALTWSLNMDSAFDSVDSLTGISTTAKSGAALRSAALPVCREMAAEVCDTEDIALVENSYNMAIEQDCNTVKRAYETQSQQAKNKILESSALLDMTRLNNYQDNNSDDILTCKTKMLDMLTNTNVCGKDLVKCLDISGRYINPTTGEAFLSPDLINLTGLIVRPTNTDTWSKTPQNAPFISYLNSKKKYIEPATKNCQSIADSVWNGFIDDALAQIKIAQNAKLEEVRQSCTTLLTECLDSAKQNLADFDSRALSTFGVITDKTVNALCENVKTSCSMIIEYDPETGTMANNTGIDETWSSGTTDIAARETYTTIINTCREVGRDCIINSCKSITGNFGLCEDIHTSVNRHSILTRSACWKQVYNCVAQASQESILNIHEILPNYNTIPQDLYRMTYGLGANDTVYDFCRSDEQVCGAANNTTANDPDVSDSGAYKCYLCRIAEQIWGNCKSKPDNSETNWILIPSDENNSTLLSWFAKNTHTQNDQDSCSTSICNGGKIDFTYTYGSTPIVMCINQSDIVNCLTRKVLCRTKITTPTNKQNCCESEKKDSFGHCCMNGMAESVSDYMGGSQLDNNIGATTKICTPNKNITSVQLVTKETNTNNNITTYILCPGGIQNSTGTNDELLCNNNYIIVECDSSSSNYKRCRYVTHTYGASANEQLNRTYSLNYFINESPQNQTDYCNAAGIDSNDTSNICTFTDTDTGTEWINTSNNQQWPYSGRSWLIDFSHTAPSNSSNP